MYSRSVRKYCGDGDSINCTTFALWKIQFLESTFPLKFSPLLGNIITPNCVLHWKGYWIICTFRNSFLGFLIEDWVSVIFSCSFHTNTTSWGTVFPPILYYSVKICKDAFDIGNGSSVVKTLASWSEGQIRDCQATMAGSLSKDFNFQSSVV